MNHLDQLVPGPAQPEEGRDGVEMAQPLVQLGHRVVGQADVGADAVRSEHREMALLTRSEWSSICSYLKKVIKR